MGSLSYYSQKAEAIAKSKDATYEPDTLLYLKNLFEWKHPNVSTYHNEKACITLLRQAAKEKTDTIRQIWIDTYTAYQVGEDWHYTDNFEHMAKLIKALRDSQEEGNYNIFLAFNTFTYNYKEKKYTRTQNQTFRSQVIGVDLDFYHMKEYQGLTYEQAIDKIKADHADIFKKYQPMIVRSGGGCQLYFLNSTPIRFFDNSNSQIDAQIHTFKELSRYFNDQFLDAGADPKCTGDGARIFKIPGVYSLKYGTPLKVILTAPGQRHSFRNIPIPPMPEKPVKRPLRAQERPTKIKEQRDIFPAPRNEILTYSKPYNDIVAKRIDDLDRVLKATAGDMEGFRESYLFIYSILLSSRIKDISEIRYILCSKNEHFKEPLPVEEIDNIIRQVLVKPYKVSNQYIYEMLLEPLRIDLTLLSGNYTEEQKKAANRERRNKCYEKKATKTYTKQQKIDFIQAHKDMSSKDIAEALQCSKRSIEILRKTA